MKNLYSRHILFKVLIVIGAEALAFWLTNLFATYVYPIKHTTVTYILCGAILAYIVVVVYDRIFVSNKRRIETELKTITDTALKRYDVDEK